MRNSKIENTDKQAVDQPEVSVDVKVEIDAAKIVRCICVASVLIVSIVMGIRCYEKNLDSVK
ncbi:hypothetical protein [Anaerobium acetethylicum]|uniref:Uncharacterized protein n=1 Tax=Anaerobium acetethylicum TaxID=1619234 RepID=A0A1D3TZ35_9FIRM|nr:hypothetical protein [Anaerobium acetethylicum]SCP99784.1 hypothetical protein SAMN05421730_10596 [Anaerobium acetethylicum]